MEVNEIMSKFKVLEKLCKGEVYKLLEDKDDVFKLFVEFQGAETFCRVHIRQTTQINCIWGGIATTPYPPLV